MKKMKASKNIFIFFLTLFFTVSCSEEVIVNETLQLEDKLLQENQYFNYSIGEGPFVQFDDINFKKLVLINFEINTNKDNEISFNEASSYNRNIDVSFNTIKSLTGVEKFINITGLNCGNNKITTLNISDNLKLKNLYCGNNPFNKINLDQNINLTHLDIRTTNISTLNLSKNINLITIRGMCNYKLKTVNLKNENNTKILVSFLGLNNPNLKCIQVDDINYSNTATNWIIPQDAIYSLNCYGQY